MGISSVLITVTIDTSQLEKKINKLIAVLPIAMKRTVVDTMDFVEVQANQNIDQDLLWGHGINQAEQIRNCWKKEIIERTSHTVKGTLSNDSPHALLQEVGGIVSTEITREEGMFTIGKSQGNIVAFSPSFHLAPGKYFLLRGAFDHIPEITEIARKNLNIAILSV